MCTNRVLFVKKLFIKITKKTWQMFIWTLP